eukprot:TRINITY_DN7034_c0_g3_i1.p1 TRINITY_DN7034_c0_g3~~TRINITY_DN7034_c0_g3_i1.p1  ORF type:complete len:565 (+),score=81.89 TRINITY_DN7034_c0_g3_i1:81-1697(+)
MTEQNKIFVGGLPKDIDETSLQSYFERVGAIRSVDLKRDIYTGLSRGFAYVTFETSSSASAVLASSHEINGKKIDCKAPQPKAASMGGGKGGDGGWVGKGDGNWTMGGVGGGWDSYGGGGGGYDSWGGGWGGGKGGCGDYNKGGSMGSGGFGGWGKGYDSWGGGGGFGKGKAGPPQHDYHPRKIFAGGLPKDMTDESVITNYFSQFGPLEKVEMKIDQTTGNSRGFCFVTYGTDEGMRACLSNRETHSLGGKWIDVKSANPNGAQSPDAMGMCSSSMKGGGKDSTPRTPEPCKVFVGGLRDVVEEDMVKFFSQFGPLKSCQLKKDPNTGQPRGFGFVEFVDEAHAQMACANSANNYIKDKWVEVRPAGSGPSKGFGCSGGFGDKGCGGKGGCPPKGYGKDSGKGCAMSYPKGGCNTMDPSSNQGFGNVGSMGGGYGHMGGCENMGGGYASAMGGGYDSMGGSYDSMGGSCGCMGGVPASMGGGCGSMGGGSMGGCGCAGCGAMGGGSMGGGGGCGSMGGGYGAMGVGMPPNDTRYQPY